MFDINLIITTLIAISTIVAFTYFNKMRSNDATDDRTTDSYEDEDLTITLLNIHNIVQESDFK